MAKKKYMGQALPPITDPAQVFTLMGLSSVEIESLKMQALISLSVSLLEEGDIKGAASMVTRAKNRLEKAEDVLPAKDFKTLNKRFSFPIRTMTTKINRAKLSGLGQGARTSRVVQTLREAIAATRNRIDRTNRWITQATIPEEFDLVEREANNISRAVEIISDRVSILAEDIPQKMQSDIATLRLMSDGLSKKVSIVGRSIPRLAGQKTRPRVPIHTLVITEAALAVKRIFPKIKRLHLVGSRLRRPVGRDIEFVAVVRNKRDLPARNMRGAIKVNNFKVDLFFALPDEVETTILEFGLGLDNIRWKKAAKDRGFKLNRFGLFKGSKKISGSMIEIAGILGKPLKPFLIVSLENPF
jgi:hypothetical protein